MAIPPILQALQQIPNQSQFSDRIKQVAETLKGIQNPQQYIQNEMMKNNPVMKNVLQEVQANGGNAQAAFYNYAQKMGINPDEILSILQGK